MHDFKSTDHVEDMQSPWEDEFMDDEGGTLPTYASRQTDELQLSDQEWSKLSDQFTNYIYDYIMKTGYREGITAGKEGSLQAGFDAGFAEVGVPLGRQVGILRGLVSGILAAFGSSPSSSTSAHLDRLRQSIDENNPAIEEIREIGRSLSKLRFSDIEPPDLEAEAHAREHLLPSTGAGDVDVMDVVDLPEEVMDRKEMEDLEDALDRLTAAETHPDDISTLKLNEAAPMSSGQLMLHQTTLRLQALVDTLGLSELNLS